MTCWKKWQDQKKPEKTGVFGLLALSLLECLIVLCSQLLQFLLSQPCLFPEGWSSLWLWWRLYQGWQCCSQHAASCPFCSWDCRPDLHNAATINMVTTMAFKICNQETKWKSKKEWIAGEMLEWSFSRSEAYIKCIHCLGFPLSFIYHHY